jgi:hypothetical protein
VFGEIGPENFQLVSAYKYCTICFMKTMIWFTWWFVFD